MYDIIVKKNENINTIYCIFASKQKDSTTHENMKNIFQLILCCLDTENGLTLCIKYLIHLVHP